PTRPPSDLPCIGQDLPVPALAGLECGKGNPQAGVDSVPGFSLGEPKSWSLRYQRGQIPFTLEADPLPVAHEVHHLGQLFMPHTAIRVAHDPCRMLSLKFFRD